MSARSDLPRLAQLAALRRGTPAADEATRALDEIDRLRALHASMLEEIGLLRRDVADAQDRGDAWREKFNADTDEIDRLRAQVERLRAHSVSTEQQAEVLASRDRYIAKMQAQVERGRPVIEAARAAYAANRYGQEAMVAAYDQLIDAVAALDSEEQP